MGIQLSHLGAAFRSYSGCFPIPKSGSLKGDVEFCDQEINVVLFLQLKGLGDDPGGFPVLLAPQPRAVHLQDDVAHLQLPTVVC